jgi:hypothetical protein
MRECVTGIFFAGTGQGAALHSINSIGHSRNRINQIKQANWLHKVARAIYRIFLLEFFSRLFSRNR